MSVMLLAIYVVYDVKADQIGAAILQSGDAPAIRAFMDAIQDPATMMSRHPEDFELLHIGTIGLDNVVVPGTRVVVTGSVVKEVLDKQSSGG